jgi:hypothetical protein
MIRLSLYSKKSFWLPMVFDALFWVFLHSMMSSLCVNSRQERQYATNLKIHASKLPSRNSLYYKTINTFRICWLHDLYLFTLCLKVCVRCVKQLEVVVLWIPFPTQQVQPLTCLSMVIQGT